jgi:parvulin-like peptidyl-prolyl isomerase
MSLATMNRWFMDNPRLGKAFLLIVFVFPLILLFGIGGIDAGCIAPGTLSKEVGTLGGKRVTQEELYQQLNSFQVKFAIDYNQFLNADSRALLAAVSDQLFKRLRALQKAQELGIAHVTNDELNDYLRNHQNLQSATSPGGGDSKFDQQKFDNLRAAFVGRGMKGNEFDQYIKENIVIDRIEARVREAVVVPEAELMMSFLRSRSQCDTFVKRFTAEEYLSEIEVTDELLETYFNDNVKDNYMIPDQVQLAVAAFKIASFEEGGDVEIKEADLRAEYTLGKETKYKRKQYHLRHILIASETPDSKQLRADKKARLGSLLEQAREAGTVAELAAKHSDDFETRDNDGDLGFIEYRFLELEIAKAAATLKVGEISKVLETNRGFQIIEKVAEREYMPFDSLELELRQTVRLRRIFDADLAKEQADADNLANKYVGEQLKCRRILKRFKAEATPEEKTEVRQKTADLLKSLRDNNKKFHSIARRESDDSKTKYKGGIVDWFDVGSYDKDVEGVLQKLDIDAISEVFENSEGLNIIQKLGHRQYTPFDEVRDNIEANLASVGKNNARSAALQSAYAFAKEVYLAAEIVDDGIKKSNIFQEIAETERVGMELITGGFFSALDAEIPGIPGGGFELIESGATTDVEQPFTGVVASDDYVYMGSWVNERLAEPSELKEQASGDPATMILSKMGRQAKSDLEYEEALKMARDAARSLHAELDAKINPIEEGVEAMPFEDATAALETSFNPTPFPLASGPQPAGDDDTSPSVIRGIAEESANATLSAAKDTNNGAVIVYVVEHTYPDPTAYKRDRAIMRFRYLSQRQQVEVNNYYTQLETEHKLKLSADWTFLIEGPEEVAAAGGSQQKSGGSGKRNSDGSNR